MQPNTDAYHFLNLDKPVGFKEANVVILPAPMTSDELLSNGLADGPNALLNASKKLELWDEELGRETASVGITTVQALHFSDDDPEWAVAMIRSKVSEIVTEKKRVVVLGGEHTVAAGSIQGAKAVHPGLNVLHLDAHADLQEQSHGNAFGPLSLLTRIQEYCPFVSVGVRSLTKKEAGLIEKKMLPVWTMNRLRNDSDWMDDVLARFNAPVYISINLDVLDPAVLPNVNRPEPNGFSYSELLNFLKRVLNEKKVVGLDLCGLCPSAGPPYGVYTAAKLLYRLIGYWTLF